MLGINGGEFLLLILIAIIVLGPQRMPEYAAKLARGVRQVRLMAEGAKGQLKEQLGPDFEDIDWRQYDPRQYDPRRIVREALVEPIEEATAPLKDFRSAVSGSGSGATAAGALAAGAAATSPAQAGAPAALDPTSYDPARPTPFDSDAT
ncbi:MAG: Sec-independent protein translocase TatB [Actinomycetia bacterium]|nr:Sec-independent protein translocase TatB [Actinomycetes bacterium]